MVTDPHPTSDPPGIRPHPESDRRWRRRCGSASLRHEISTSVGSLCHFVPSWAQKSRLFLGLPRNGLCLKHLMILFRFGGAAARARCFCCLATLLSAVGCGDSHGVQNGDSGTTPDVRTTHQDVSTPLRDAVTPPEDRVVVLVDRVVLPDVAAPVACVADNATINVCGFGTDERIPEGAFFDGKRCVIWRGNCRGPDCFKYSAFPAELALANCETANAGCMQIKCAQTGGHVRNGCNVRCGADQSVCEGGHSELECDCGPGKTFDGNACVNDASCTVGDLCRATGGLGVGNEGCGGFRPVPMDSGDAGPAAAIPCRPFSCECTRGRAFIEGRGCVAIASALPCSSHQCQCTSSGGRWEPNTCGGSRCGAPSALTCASGGCICGPQQVWDDSLGCIDSFDCKRLRRPLGTGCATDSDCEEALACCGGTAINQGSRTCVTRTCDGDSAIAGCPPAPA